MSMTARESKPSMKDRLVFWLREMLSGKTDRGSEHLSQVEDDLDWLSRLNPAIEELLDVAGAVPEEIRGGVVNYIVARMQKSLYPDRDPRLSGLIGAQIYADLVSSREGVDYIMPHIRDDEPLEVKVIESMVDDLEAIYS